MVSKLFLFCIGFMLCTELFACNINTASVKELTALKGIGKSTAMRIVQYRKVHEFSSIDEIMKIKGIGKKKFASIKSELSI